MLLNPRFKSLNFLSQAERNAIVHSVKEELASNLVTLDSGCGLTASSESDLTMGQLSQKPKKGKVMTLLSDVLGTDAAERDAASMNAAEMAHREVTNYVAHVPAQDCRPLEWWKENCQKLPLLAKLAKEYLWVPATSVPSERAFSLTGYIPPFHMRN